MIGKASSKILKLLVKHKLSSRVKNRMHAYHKLNPVTRGVEFCDQLQVVQGKVWMKNLLEMMKMNLKMMMNQD